MRTGVEGEIVSSHSGHGHQQGSTAAVDGKGGSSMDSSRREKGIVFFKKTDLVYDSLDWRECWKFFLQLPLRVSFSCMCVCMVIICLANHKKVRPMANNIARTVWFIHGLLHS